MQLETTQGVSNEFKIMFGSDGPAGHNGMRLVVQVKAVGDQFFEIDVGHAFGDEEIGIDLGIGRAGGGGEAQQLLHALPLRLRQLLVATGPGPGPVNRGSEMTGPRDAQRDGGCDVGSPGWQ